MPLLIDDVVAIHELVARYCHAFDSEDAEGFAGTFVPDGALTTAGTRPVRGRDALRAFAVAGAARSRALRHHIGNVIVEGDQDSAKLRAYLLITARGEDGALHPVTTGSYADTVVRVGGRWLFVERVFTPD